MTPAPIPPELSKALEHAKDESKPALERIAAASSARDMLDEWLREIAGQARDEGFSWAQVGSKLGTSRQAAHQRFSKRVIVERRSLDEDEDADALVAKILREHDLDHLDVAKEMRDGSINVTRERHDGTQIVTVKVRKTQGD